MQNGLIKAQEAGFPRKAACNASIAGCECRRKERIMEMISCKIAQVASPSRIRRNKSNDLKV